MHRGQREPERDADGVPGFERDGLPYGCEVLSLGQDLVRPCGNVLHFERAVPVCQLDEFCANHQNDRAVNRLLGFHKLNDSADRP